MRKRYMYCEYCGRIDDHHPRCPLYSPPIPFGICELCGEGIWDNEEYLVTSSGYAHYDCASWDTRALLEWLGIETKTVDSESFYWVEEN